MKRLFTFEIPIESEEYSPETCKRDYGSAKAYNSDFPRHVYAIEHLSSLCKDASSFCRMMALKMMADKKSEPETWDARDRAYFEALNKRAAYYDSMMSKIKCVREEDCP